jgi:hypothetical protein
VEQLDALNDAVLMRYVPVRSKRSLLFSGHPIQANCAAGNCAAWLVSDRVDKRYDHKRCMTVAVALFSTQIRESDAPSNKMPSNANLSVLRRSAARSALPQTGDKRSSRGRDVLRRRKIAVIEPAE